MAKKTDNKNKTQGENKVIQVKKEGLSKLKDEEKVLLVKFDDPEKKLAEHTKFIRKHLNTVMAVAARLYEVKENKLFRVKYNTFKDYVNEEFNYTRGRAYQLTAAYEIADFINNKQNAKILTTEPQCRELSRIRVFSKEDKLDVDKTNQERLKLVQGILETNNNKISTSMIEKNVQSWLADNRGDVKELSVTERFDKSIDQTCDNIYKMVKNIIADNDDITQNDIEQIKGKLEEKLNETIENIKKDIKK